MQWLGSDCLRRDKGTLLILEQKEPWSPRSLVVLLGGVEVEGSGGKAALFHSNIGEIVHTFGTEPILPLAEAKRDEVSLLILDMSAWSTL